MTETTDNQFAPLSKKDRREAIGLAAKIEMNPITARNDVYRLARLLLRYENALQSVGYTDR